MGLYNLIYDVASSWADFYASIVKIIKVHITLRTQKLLLWKNEVWNWSAWW